MFPRYVGRTILAINLSECLTGLLEKIVKQYKNGDSPKNNRGACMMTRSK